LASQNRSNINFSHPKKKNNFSSPTKKATTKTKIKSKAKPVSTKHNQTEQKKDSNTVVVKTSTISTDEGRFQNRSKLNQRLVNQIVNNFSPAQFDPPVVWKDPKDKKTYILAGHHRLEAIKRLDKKEIPVRYFEGTEKEAIRFAKVESNANRTLETPFERSKIYREMIADNMSKKDLEKRAEIEGKNKNYILNLAHLNDKGMVIDFLQRLEDGQDVQDQQTIKKVSDWIGQARRQFKELTNQHEREMFEFLMDKKASKRITKKVEFLQKINSIVQTLTFEADKPLNLKRFKYKSEGESIYEEEVSELKAKINNNIDAIQEIKSRFTDLNRSDYISPDHKNYDDIQELANGNIEDLNQKNKYWQKKLLKLQQNKGKYTNAGSAQAALFGANIKKSNFNTALIKAVKKGIKPTDIFVLGKPKGELKNHLMDIDISLTGRVIKKAIAQTPNHNLNFANFLNLPSYINNPTAIFKSKSSGFVVLTEIRDTNNKPVMVVIRFNKKRKNYQIPSMYVRNNYNTYKKWIDDELHLYLNKKSDLFTYAQATIALGEKESQGKSKTNKGLKQTFNKNPKIKNGAALNNDVEPEFYKILGETGKFLQRVEKKPIHSVAVTIDGPQGAGKTTMVYQFINDFCKSGKTLFASLEQHPQSSLTKEKINAYISHPDQVDIIGDFDNKQEFYDIIEGYDFIFIDSWQKLLEMIGHINFDQDLRKKFDGKVFVVIFQQTTTGRTKGGAAIVFDGDIIIKMEKHDDFSKNCAYFDKNRYSQIPTNKITYNISKAQCLVENKEKPKKDNSIINSVKVDTNFIIT
jgi:ParB-like chromosome segregation protein Spo0J